ncbi:Dabb family protein [Puniceibacterium sp. IMCC21224]|uniref:Dabb family protein n=1 Tax=Puniceibacterium sp. IMCC21224 TaxID=1618204 RepID=UPI00064D8EB2|nr:Dabb family protein [Puniceibacterium sp. IMCC21224]KMK68446.1 Stress responsive A/B Barrel Domain-containing protein [Puniceibacterium sp. IMCC21224]
MIRHIVLIRFRPDVDAAQVSDLWRELHEIEGKIPGLLSITSGRSESPEKMERGYMHGFVADFASWDALEAYQQNPDHQRLGARLSAHAEGGKDGILCFDLPVSEPAS